VHRAANGDRGRRGRAATPNDPSATVRTITPDQAMVTCSSFVSAGGDRNTTTQQLPIKIGGSVMVDPAQTGRVIWTG
jgi:hypothetical protein